MSIDFAEVINRFIAQAQVGDLKVASYPKDYNDLAVKVSFGMGAPARIPWIAFTAPEMSVSKGYYPVYLYYKQLNTLILSYGISETEEFGKGWPEEILSSSETIEGYFDSEVPRYGDSFVFKAYKISLNDNLIKITDPKTGSAISNVDLQSDLERILSIYKKAVNMDLASETSPISQGVFYMEKQLEDFIIHNWESTELGKKYNLIIEDGEMMSQQYRTDLGPIDILARDKKNGNYVVIELKKNQTSDDTIGQIARYMGWIKSKKGDKNVKGVIIAGSYDKRLEYALKMVPDINVYIYKVDFTLNEFHS